jgi:hypothetical protein
MRFLLALLACVGCSCSAAIYYISPSGSDSGDGSIGSPWATLAKARNSMSSGDTTYLRGGTYLLSSAFTLGYTNSGTTYRAYSGETPVIYGGLKITNFTTFSGSMKVTDVSTQGVSGVFRQLLYNDERQPMARKPNMTPDIHDSWLYSESASTTTNFVYKAGDLGTYGDIEHAQVMTFATYGYYGWLCDVSSINTGTRTLTVKTAVWPKFAAGDRYYIQGVGEELDAAGEWWLDGTNKFLYFWPPSEGGTVYVPVVSNLVTIASGSSNITIRGLTIECCQGTAITLTGTTNCLIAGNKIKNLGEFDGRGIVISGGFTNGAVGNDLLHIGRDGIYISGGAQTTLTPANNYADNNFIDHAVEYNHSGSGIYVEGVGNRVSRNLVKDCTQIGIRFMGQNLLVQSNEVCGVMYNNDDGGAIYVYQNGAMDWLSGRGCKVVGNYVHDVFGYGYNSGGTGCEAYGIYIDGLVCGVDVASNIVVNIGGTGLHMSGGSDNRYTNNVLVNCANVPKVTGLVNISVDGVGYASNTASWYANKDSFQSGYDSIIAQPAWSGMRGLTVAPSNHVYGAGLVTMWSNVYWGNIILYTNAAYATNSVHDKGWNFSSSAQELQIIDRNVTYHYGNLVLNQINSVAKYWSDWQALGYDTNGSTNDPVLNADYSLPLDSPARSIGIASLSTNNIGPYFSADRASWPVGSSGERIGTATTINAGTVNIGP